MSDAYEDKLQRAASQLATEIAPERDLWPGIAESITAPRRQRFAPTLAQAAAVVLLVAGSSGITYLAVSDGARPVTAVAPDLVFEQAAFGGNYSLGPDFQHARDSLIADLDAEIARLSPETQQEIQANIDLIHDAIVEINKALKAEPDNVMLQQQLLHAYREELTLLRRVGGLTRNVMMRNDI